MRRAGSPSAVLGAMLGAVFGVVLVLWTAAAGAQPTGASVSGTVFHDHDGDGTRDPEDEGVGCFGPLPPPSIPYLQDRLDVQLVTVPDDGAPRSAEVSADGTYTFTDVAPGSYVLEGPPCRYPDRVAPASLLSAYTTPQQRPIDVDVVPVTGVDFGIFDRPFVDGGTFRDDNRDGVSDGFFSGIDGCTVTATRSPDGAVTTAISKPLGFPVNPHLPSPGHFELTLDPGTYVLSAACTGYDRTSPDRTVVARSRENTALGFGFVPHQEPTTTTTAVSALPRTGTSAGRVSLLGMLAVVIGAGLAASGRRVPAPRR